MIDLGEILEKIGPFVLGLIENHAAWQSYTPVWYSTSNPQPSLGNGTLVGRYRQIGKSVLVYIDLTMGSSTTYGTGAWSFSLPVTAAAPIKYFLGNVLVWDSSTAANRQMHECQVQTTTTVVCYLREALSTSFEPTNPITWAAGDVLRIQIEYEAA